MLGVLPLLMSHSLRMSIRTRIVVPAVFFAALALISGCGYSTQGKAVKVAPSIQTIYMPAFVNQTQKFKVEQILTVAVVREFTARSRFKVSNDPDAEHQATLKGTVLSAVVTPLTYDSATGRASTATVTITMRVTLTDKDGKPIFDRQNYTFRETYQISRELSSFFEEESPSIDRLARDFARTLVADVLEDW